MQSPRILRAHLWASLVAALALILLLIGFFWYQSSPVPRYPCAQNLIRERPEQPGPIRSCSSLEEEYHYPVRITRFVTADSPDAVLRFYRNALVEYGSYRVVARRRQQVTFHDETPINNQVPSNHLPNGYGVFIDTMAVSDRTAVWITEYEYERLGRACHP